MSSTAQVSPSAVSAGSYVSAPRGAAWARRWWWFGGGGAALALLLAAAQTSGGGFFSRWFGGAGPEAATYVVKPLSLAITLSEDGELKPRQSVEVKCELEGQSTILFVVPESTHVQAGELLVELASDEIKNKLETEDIEVKKIRTALDAAVQDLAITRNENASKLEKCRIDLEVAELELERYTEGDYKRELKNVTIQIRQTETEIQQRKDELEKNEPLLEKGYVTRIKLDEMRFNLWKAEQTLAKNELDLHILETYEGPKNEKQKKLAIGQAREELAREQQRGESREKQAQAKVEEQQALLAVRDARLARLRQQLEKCRVFAPVEGVVQYPGESMMWRSNSSRIAPGEKAFEGQVLIVLPDISQMVVTTRIHEADRHRVKEGLPCRISVPAVPGRSFMGRISKIARFADSEHRWFNPELKEHATEILLDATDAPVSPGDSAEIQIFIEQTEEVLAVPVQAVFSRGSKRYVFTRSGGAFEPVEVKLGRATNTLIEVVSGLGDGAEVLMKADESLVARLPAARVEAPEHAPQFDEAEAPPPPAASPRERPSGGQRRGRPGVGA